MLAVLAAGVVVTSFLSGIFGMAGGMILMGLLLAMMPLPAAMVLHAVLYVFVLAPLINGLGHWHGRQTFRNSAYNIRLLSYVTGGGGASTMPGKRLAMRPCILDASSSGS